MEKSQSFYTIAYPIKRNVLSTWFKDEIIGDLGANKTPIDFEATLTQEEFNVLSILLVYSGYSQKSGKPMIINQMITPEFLEFVEAKDTLKIRELAVKSIIEAENVKTILKQLKEQAILKFSDDIISLHEIHFKAFSADQLRDIVEIKEVSPFNRGKNLYITNLGYLIFEPILSYGKLE